MGKKIICRRDDLSIIFFYELNKESLKKEMEIFINKIIIIEIDGENFMAYQKEPGDFRVLYGKNLYFKLHFHPQCEIVYCKSGLIQLITACQNISV